MHLLGFFEACKFVKTGDPIGKIWSIWTKYSDLNYLKYHWPNHTESDYLYVATCIKQAYEYFRASSELSLETKPLLLYYSFLNLTKAALFIATDVRPNGNYHGLSEPDGNKANFITKSEDFLTFNAKTNGGIFDDLSKHLGREFQRNEISMENFLSSSVELDNVFSEYYHRKPSFISARVDAFLDGKVHVIFNNVNELNAEIVTRIKTSFERFDFNDSNSFKFVFDLGQKSFSQLSDEVTELLKPCFEFSILSDEQGYFYNVNQERMPSACACSVLHSCYAVWYDITRKNFTICFTIRIHRCSGW